nr:glycosyltransferase family 2 protein [uncultured Acidocella sp.]
MTAMDAAFHTLIRRLRSPDWSDDVFGPPQRLGPEFDPLSLQRGPADWSEAQKQAVAALQAIKPRRKLAALLSTSNDALILPEWIAHHLAVGVEKFFIYTNDNHDRTESLLRWFAQHAPVTLAISHKAPGVDVQVRNYHHALFLQPELRLYEWIAVLDSDEYLMPGPQFGHHMTPFLEAVPQEAGAVLWPWHWRLWEQDFTRAPGLLAEQYQYATPHSLVKSVTRTGQIASLHQIHFPEFEPARPLYDTAFAPIEKGHNWHLQGKTYAGGCVEHFWARSFAEFMVKKRRGEALELIGTPHARALETYFTWSQAPSPETWHPWPEQVLAKTKAHLARFQADPYFAALERDIRKDFEDYTAQLRQDSALCAAFEERTGRSAWAPARASSF